MDIVSRAVRSRMMGGIGPRNTQPEMTVRRYLHAAGLRYRLHARGLPGRPDIVLPAYRAVVFVHGCFWHRHLGCSNAVLPGSNRQFWVRKLTANRRRDRAAIASLRHQGWRVGVMWECAVRRKDATAILGRLENWIRGSRPFIELPALTHA